MKTGTFTVVLGVLVWKDLLTLKEAEKLDFELGNRIVPATVSEVVEELNKARKK